ncbi:phage tail protein [Paenibacillus polymyxa]|uniref:S 49 n=1 Tax=Paenibacillus polymyxa (strain SC2) TaxID=886882 RepID=E3E9D9_PAEPS|nr:phage tail protein [Paenibacillus polymyxa]ADO57412.1 S 49 [Paenibacillus polymyxa SC2]WPQ55184.1 phage tail protein [Paenibacillus polymyxa]CCI70078.1 Tail fiber protein gpS [Paenibacillus polymyxa M1]
MPIKQPRRFVTTDQGHADVLNVPIDTLYENDQALAEQIENIKNDPAGNDIASKAALDSHISDTNLHVTTAKQATWNAAEGNAKKYTEQYAAPKAHTHPASDLPSASTQARGIVQINTSVSSTSTDQAAAPIAVKTAYDRANEAYSRADQAFTQAVDLKNKISGAINGKGGSANASMTGDQFAAAITNLPGKRWARGTFNGQNAQASSWGQSVAMNVAVNNLAFVVSRVFVWVKLTESDGFSQVEGFVTSSREGTNQTIRGWRSNSVGIDTLPPTLTNGFNLTVTGSRIDAYAGGSPVSKVWAYEWWAFE